MDRIGVVSTKAKPLSWPMNAFSIVDPASGGQPLVSPDGKLILCVNGEIYNHQELRERLKGDYEFQTGSDCEVILALYKKKGIDFIEDTQWYFRLRSL